MLFALLCVNSLLWSQFATVLANCRPSAEFIHRSSLLQERSYHEDI